MIQFTSLSFEQIKTDLITYSEGLPDYESWRDFFEGGSGTTLIQLMAGLGSYLSYHSMMARREGSLFYAKLRSTIYGIAALLGYPVNRKSAALFDMTIRRDASEPTIVWSRYDVNGDSNPIGTIKSVPLSFVLDDVQLIPGYNYFNSDPGRSQIVIGQWKKYELTATNSQDFFEVNVIVSDPDLIDNDYIEVWLDKQDGNGWNRIPTVKYVEELDPTNCLIHTLGDRVLVIFGDDFFGLKIQSSYEIRIEYLEVGDVSSDYDPENISLDIGDVYDQTLIHPMYNEDSLVKITRVAPGYFATKRRMITLEDHDYVVMGQPGVVSANAKKATWIDIDPDDPDPEDPCCTVIIAYLFDDYHVMDTDEETALLTELEDYRMQGELLIFRDPSLIAVNVEMTVVIDSGADTALIQSESYEYITAQLCYQLGITFQTGKVVTAVSKMDFVKRVYLTTPTFDKELDSETEYFKYFTIDPDDGGSLTMSFVTDDTLAFEYGTTLVGYSE